MSDLIEGPWERAQRRHKPGAFDQADAGIALDEQKPDPAPQSEFGVLAAWLLTMVVFLVLIGSMSRAFGKAVQL